MSKSKLNVLISKPDIKFFGQSDICSAILQLWLHLQLAQLRLSVVLLSSAWSQVFLYLNELVKSIVLHREKFHVAELLFLHFSGDPTFRINSMLSWPILPLLILFVLLMCSWQTGCYQPTGISIRSSTLDMGRIQNRKEGKLFARMHFRLATLHQC